jgi:hypothetical protein
VSRLALLLLAGMCWFPAQAQLITEKSPCLPRGDYIPALVPNPDNKVTFQCQSGTPLDLIVAVGFQTRSPIGVVLGQDTAALTRTPRAFNLDVVDVQTALSAAIEGTGYTIRNEDGVTVLTAGDLAPHQRDLLLHTFSGFGGKYTNRMVCWGINLTIALRRAVHSSSGFAASCSTSPNDEEFALTLPASPTTEEIANAIVSQDSHGIWVFRVPATVPPGDPTETVEIITYQHYTNRPVALR